MANAIVTGVFGVVLAGLVVYAIQRIDRLAEQVAAQGERLVHVEDGLVHLEERLTRIEGKLDEHLRDHHPQH